MDQYFTPRQLADALAVSESSVKRWADQGLMPVERTAGGHRRLPVAGIIQFIRASELSLARPELLGIVEAPEDIAGAEGLAPLAAALAVGDEGAFRAAVFRSYLAGASVAEICDREIAPAFRALGHRWEHGSLEVYQERRACEICRGVLFELRRALPPPSVGALSALGGTLAGDWYTLPTAMCDVALAELGWASRSLGSSQPAATLAAAIATERPRLFWVSVSWIESLDVTVDALAEIWETARRHRVALAVGGHAIDAEARRRLRATAFCDDLAQLQDLAVALGNGLGDEIAAGRMEHADGIRAW
jgi:excisionase family DNA binding protein